MKKTFILFILIFLMFGLIACKNNKYVHQYDLVSKHLYSDNITVDIPYSINGEDKYISIDFPFILQGYISLLNIDCYAQRINTNINKYISSNTNKQTVIIKSLVDDSNLCCYVNQDGTLITTLDDKLYIAESNVINYEDFVSFSSSKDLNEFNILDNAMKDVVTIQNKTYNTSTDSAIKSEFCEKLSKERNKDILLLKLPGKVYGENKALINYNSKKIQSLKDYEDYNAISIGMFSHLISIGKEWVLLIGIYDTANYVVVGDLMDNLELDNILHMKGSESE